MPKARLRDVVVVLPGILGSALSRRGEVLWDLSGRAVLRALTSLGRSIDALRLEQDDPLADDPADEIRATHTLRTVHLIPGFWKIDGYTQLIRLVCDRFQVVEGDPQGDRPANFFELPYDWRRDNRVAARALRALVERHLPRWREHSGAADARVILLAHSMGGLISRYYLEVLGGWESCRALVTFGTPYRGSLNALRTLSDGFWFSSALTEVARSCTSIYQLLPIYEVLDVAGRSRRIAEVDGVPNVSRPRAEDALRFHREIEDAVERNRKTDAYHERGYKILPIVGTRQRTQQSAVLRDGHLEVGLDPPPVVPGDVADGDGTVPRVSAIPIELSAEYRDTFVAEKHSSLQVNGAVLEDLRGRLLQMQNAAALAAIRGSEPSLEYEKRPALSLELDDLVSARDPGELIVRLAGDSAGADPVLGITAIDGDRECGGTRKGRRRNGAWSFPLSGIGAGLYRVEVRHPRTTPIHDVFEVTDQE